MGEREEVSVVTRKGQVTIPVRIRCLLGVKPDDRVLFRAEEGRVYLAAVKETLEAAYGAVTPIRRPEDLQALRDQAITEHADRAFPGASEQGEIELSQ